ncbi:MAG: TIGR03936 family radical SAM-associated protein [Anaerolineaceae bacterium]|jgi:radical SAM-linked protein
MQRIRLVYSKGDELKFTGNLDMMKVWERTFRRAGLKIAYSQGFHPQPKIHQALPLPLGFTSQNDLLDFWLDSDENLGEISKKLERALQPGITVQEYQVVPAALKPLQTLVTSAEYLVRMETESIHADLTERIEKLLRQNECLRERRGKQYDLRPLIESLQIDKDDTSSLLMTLAARPGATGRPEEVLDALGIAMQDIEIMRSGMILSE